MPERKTKTMTLNLTDVEMGALEELAKARELTKTAILRQALKLYQLLELRISQGEKLYFEDDLTKKKAELLLI
jgi:predicted transcriptional regulator